MKPETQTIARGDYAFLGAVACAFRAKIRRQCPQLAETAAGKPQRGVLAEMDRRPAVPGDCRRPMVVSIRG